MARSAHALADVMRWSHRAWTCTVVLAGASACRQPNPEWLGPSGDPITSGASESGSATDAATDTSSPLQCAPEPVPGQGDCPTTCTACEDGRCIIDCDARDCDHDDVACPEGWPCDFECIGWGACEQADLRCASDRDCTVVCEDSEACQGTTVACGGGTCTVTCGDDDDVCRRLDVVCGSADTTLTCAAASNAGVVSSGSPCACEAVGCGD